MPKPKTKRPNLFCPIGGRQQHCLLHQCVFWDESLEKGGACRIVKMVENLTKIKGKIR